MNIQGATEKVEKTIDISKYLPEGVSLVDDAAKNVTATATIEEDGTRTVDFMVASIKIRNLSDSLQVSYEPDAEVILTFRGSPKLLEALDVSNAVSVNLQNFTKAGTYDVPVDVDLPTVEYLSASAAVFCILFCVLNITAGLQVDALLSCLGIAGISVCFYYRESPETALYATIPINKYIFTRGEKQRCIFCGDNFALLPFADN